MSAESQRLAGALFTARRVVGGSAGHGSVTGEAVRLAEACLALGEALADCRRADRSAAYAYGETRPWDGATPEQAGGEPGTCWLTPREIVDHLLGPVPTAVEPQIDAPRAAGATSADTTTGAMADTMSGAQQETTNG